MAAERNEEMSQIPELEPIDFDKMSADQLDALMRRDGGQEFDPELLKDVPEAPPEVEEAPEPEPEPVAAEAPVEEAPVEEPQEEDDLPDERDLALEEMRIKLERVEQERNQERYIASQNAGKMGHLQKQLEQLTSAERRPTTAESDDLDDSFAEARTARPQPRVPSRTEDEVAELLADSRTQAAERVYYEFLNQVESDLKQQGVAQDAIQAEQERVLEKITPTLQERFSHFGDLSQMGPKSLAKVTRMVFQSAYTDTKLARVAELRQQLAERKRTQIAESRIVKQQAASPSGSGGKSVQEPPPKRIEDMTAEEADAEMMRLSGERTSIF